MTTTIVVNEEGTTVADQLDEDELGAYFALVAAGDLVQRAVASQLREHGLTPVQFSVLAHLLSQPDGLRMSELADSMVVSRSGLTYQVIQLEKAGLLTRAGSLGDDRGVIARLTDAGRAKVTAAFPGHVALVRENFLDLITPDEMGTLSSTLQRVVSKLRRGKPIAE